MLSDDCRNGLAATAVSREPTALAQRVGPAGRNACYFEFVLSARMMPPVLAVFGEQRVAASMPWVGIELKPLMHGSGPLLTIQIAGRLLPPFALA